jgi:protein-tyrosine-phosphatase
MDIQLVCDRQTVHGSTKLDAREARMADRPYHVLFLCTANSARSVMAEAIMNREGQGRFVAHSAGSHPRGAINPYAADLLTKLNFDVSTLRSKSWDQFAQPGAPELDFVFTVCDDAAAETCPVWRGGPMQAHWGIPDPAIATGSEAERRFAFADAFRMLNQRITIFVNLPLGGLDKLGLQKKLDDIGHAGERVS